MKHEKFKNSPKTICLFRHEHKVIDNMIILKRNPSNKSLPLKIVFKYDLHFISYRIFFYIYI